MVIVACSFGLAISDRTLTKLWQLEAWRKICMAIAITSGQMLGIG